MPKLAALWEGRNVLLDKPLGVARAWGDVERSMQIGDFMRHAVRGGESRRDIKHC